MARLRRATPAISPSMMRRTGNSLAQNMPLRKVPTPMCQSAIAPDREEREQPGSAGEHEQTDDQQALALVAVRERARRDAEQEHRRHAQERHERHQKGEPLTSST